MTEQIVVIVVVGQATMATASSVPLLAPSTARLWGNNNQPQATVETANKQQEQEREQLLLLLLLPVM